MGISLTLSRILGFVRATIIASMFGQSAYTDAYTVSFTLPDLIFYLVAGGALSSAFIPVFTEYWSTDRKNEAWHIFSVVTTLMLILVTSVVTVLWIFTPAITPIIAAGKDPALYPLISEMGRIILPCQIAFFIGGLMFATLYVRNVYEVGGLGPNIYNIGIIIGALVISHFVAPGVKGMSWGAVIGAFAGNIIVPYIVMKRMGSKFSFSLDLKHPGVVKVFKLMLPVLLGLSLPGIFSIIMRYFGGFYQAGVNTALENANQLMQAPLAIFGQSMALAIFPALSTFFANNEMGKFREQMNRTMRTVLYLGVPSAAIMIAIPDFIIGGLLGHGNFNTEAVNRTSVALQMFAIGIPAWCLHPILMRGYFSLQKSVPPIVMGTIATGFFFAASWVVTKMGFGFGSLPLVGSFAIILLVIAMLASLGKELKGLDYWGLASTFCQSAVSAGVMAAFLWLTLHAHKWMGAPGGKIASIALLFFACLIGIWIYYFVSKAFKMPESAYLDRAMKKLPGAKKTAPEAATSEDKAREEE